MTERRVISMLAAAVGRPEWGRAMLAELGQLSSSRARREFVLGCLRALVASLPAVAAAAFASGLLSVVLVVVALLRYPGLVTGAGTWFDIGLFLCVVFTYVVVAAGLAARLVGSRMRATVWGAAGIAGAWTALVSSPSLPLPAGTPLALFGLGLAVALGLGWWATPSASSPWVGMQCVGLASVLAGFVVFLLWAGETVMFAGRPYDAGLMGNFRSSGAPDLATYAVNGTLGAAMMLLLLVPLASVAAGLAGAAVATGRSRRDR